jgi:hypothetical protein
LPDAGRRAVQFAYLRCGAGFVNAREFQCKLSEFYIDV